MFRFIPSHRRSSQLGRALWGKAREGMHSRDSMTIYICMDGGIDGRGWKELIIIVIIVENSLN